MVGDHVVSVLLAVRGGVDVDVVSVVLNLSMLWVRLVVRTALVAVPIALDVTEIRESLVSFVVRRCA